MLTSLVIGLSLVVAAPPKAGMVITRTTKLDPGTYTLPNGSEDGTGAAIVIKGDNLTVDFKGVTLRGTPATTAPNERKGTAVLVMGKNVTVRNLKAHGYKIGLIAKDSPGLNVLDSDLSYNWKQHLKSGLDREDLSDWMSFHQNEKGEWLRFGAGIYLDNCDKAKIRGVKVTGGQCGLMMTRSDEVVALNNDFSFLSAVGVGMYRSSHCMIAHNKIDWCVRGYSHGVYNRGQDSTGILIYEQSNNNTFAFNSVTHGGDGFFLWAGQTTMDTGKGGCNDNLLYGNDFSHAPTNGIEATFSRNTFANNLILECWHGVWGGYSYETKIVGNLFGYNAEAIAIEHGQDNLIASNRFVRDLMGINLWQNATQDPNWGYPKNRDTASRDTVISGNRFEHTGGPVFRLKGIKNLAIDGNRFERTGALLATEPAAENLILRKSTGFLTDARKFRPLEQIATATEDNDMVYGPQYGPLPPVMQPSGNTVVSSEANQVEYLARFKTGWDPFKDPMPEFAEFAIKPISGGMNPFLKQGELRGRRYILVDEWGPYDFRSPKLWPRAEADGTVDFEVLGPKGRWKVVMSEGIQLSSASGTVPGNVSGKLTGGLVRLTLEYVGAATTDYRGIWTAAGKPVRFGWSRFNVPQQWTTKFWNYDVAKTDPRKGEDIYGGQPAAEVSGGRLAFDWYNAPAQNVSPNHFATDTTGTIDVPAGNYVLEFTADDGIRVEIDGEQVVDFWQYSPPKVHTVRRKLGGKHTIRIRHFELDGFATLKFAIRPDR